MSKELFVSNLSSDEMIGEEFEESFLLKDIKLSKNLSNQWANLVLFDKTGEIPGIIFGEDAVNAVALKGRIVKVRGLADLYNGGVRVKCKNILPTTEELAEDYVPSLPEEMSADLIARLNALVGSVTEKNLSVLLRSVFSCYISRFKMLPGGARHHVFAGGLLAHSVETAETTDLICRQQSDYYGTAGFADRDLAVTAALLHDFGKVTEFKNFPFGEYTDVALYSDPANRGVQMLQSVIVTIIRKYPDTAAEWNKLFPLLTNVVLCCHNTGARTRRIETRIVMLADKMSADTDAFNYEVSKHNAENPEEEGAFYSRYFGCKIVGG